MSTFDGLDISGKICNGLGHVVGWERYDLHNLPHVNLVGSVVYTSFPIGMLLA